MDPIERRSNNHTAVRVRDHRTAGRGQRRDPLRTLPEVTDLSVLVAIPVVWGVGPAPVHAAGATAAQGSLVGGLRERSVDVSPNCGAGHRAVRRPPLLLDWLRLAPKSSKLRPIYFLVECVRIHVKCGAMDALHGGQRSLQIRIASYIAAWTLRLATASPMRNSQKFPSGLFSIGARRPAAIAWRSISPRLRETDTRSR